MSDNLWEIVENGFRWHIHAYQGDETWQDAMNRITKKVLGAKGIQNPPVLTKRGCTIQRSVRTREQLASVERHHYGTRPLPDTLGPPTLLSHDGREYVIDGHHRINNYLTSQRKEPFEVILLTPRKVESNSDIE